MVMNEKKICFIMCANDEKYVTEQMRYLNALRIPEGYEIEVLSIWEAVSMAAGYNEAMAASDAKYKIYLHQDVFIINPDFISDMLKVFEHPEIGMLGMVGAVNLPENAIMWSGERVGKICANGRYFSKESEMSGLIEGEEQVVEAVDGLLMATQYDVPWREDIFDGWDFYDVSQSQEFIRKGYQVVVPRQKHPWCLHDDGVLGLKNYHYYREKFLEEYRSKT